MRQVVSISMTSQQVEILKKRVEKRGFDSISDYFKFLFNGDDDYMTEEEIIRAAKEAEREYRQGKLKKLKSLDELM